MEAAGQPSTSGKLLALCVNSSGFSEGRKRCKCLILLGFWKLERVMGIEPT